MISFNTFKLLFSKTYILLVFITTAFGDNIDKYPYLASIEYHSLKSVDLLCDGAVISSQLVLTLASCIPHSSNQDYRYHRVRVGKRDGPEFNILNVEFHEDYDGAPNSTYNLALIKLQEPVNIDPIPIFDQEIGKGAQGQTAAWGDDRMDDLHTVDVTVADREECNESWVEGKLKDSHVCTEKVDWFPTTCYFESGGPLVIEDKLAGIATLLRHDQCLENPYPMVFVQVPYFRKWIDEKMAADGEK